MSASTTGKGQYDSFATYRAPTRSAPSQEDSGDFEAMVCSISDSVKDYGGKHPLVVASAIFLAGFYVGWKIKPW